MSRYRIVQIGNKQFRAKWRTSWLRCWRGIDADGADLGENTSVTLNSDAAAREAVRLHIARKSERRPFKERIVMDAPETTAAFIVALSPPPPTGGSSIVPPK